MKLTSPVFSQGESIPQKYTMYGENVIPPLRIESVPPEARSLVLIVDDPDATYGTFTHWLLFNIHPKVREIGEKTIPHGSVQGRNDYGRNEYGGPKPPSGEHRYYFKLFALNSILQLPEGASRAELESAITKHVVDHATLMGRYAK